jgi:hypothetical protein
VKSLHYDRFHFWGSEYRKPLFKKWYDGYTGFYIFNRKILGLWLQDRNLVVNFKKRPFETKRIIDLTLYIVHWIFIINLLEVNKSKYIGNIKKETHFERNYHWYEGFTGIKILNLKFMGFSITDGNTQENDRYIWIFLYIFGFTFSIDIIKIVE